MKKARAIHQSVITIDTHNDFNVANFIKEKTIHNGHSQHCDSNRGENDSI
jgi:hypothetical protein